MIAGNAPASLAGSIDVPCSDAVDRIVRGCMWRDASGVEHRFAPSAALILNAILAHAGKLGCFPSHRTIAERLRLSPDTVRRWVRRLESSGLLRRWERFRRGRQTSNEYRPGRALIEAARALRLRVGARAQAKQRREKYREPRQRFGAQIPLFSRVGRAQGARSTDLNDQQLLDLIGVPRSERAPARPRDSLRLDKEKGNDREARSRQI